MQIEDAVKSKEEIKRIASLLEKHYGSIYSHMWIFGVNAAHSMRKTLGWTMYSAGERIERICKVLNHKDSGVTMRYIGLTQADIDSAYHEYEIRF